MWLPKHKRILLNEAFPEWFSGNGIFGLLTNAPWGTVDSLVLDMDYFGNHSGEKLITPLVHKLLNGNEEIEIEGREILAALVKTKFYPIWTKLWATYQTTYNPLTNYTMTESGESIGTEDGEDTLRYGSNESRPTSRQGNRADATYGFNSANAVPTNTTQFQESATDTLTRAGADTATSEKSRADEYSKTRTGFNGMHTYQQLIKEERDLWKVDFFSRVYADLDSILTLPIYPAEAVLNNPYWIPSYPNI